MSDSIRKPSRLRCYLRSVEILQTTFSLKNEISDSLPALSVRLYHVRTILSTASYPAGHKNARPLLRTGLASELMSAQRLKKCLIIDFRRHF